MPPVRRQAVVAPLAVLGSVTCLGLGTSLAKIWLFPSVGAQGTTALRVGFSALVLLALWRPWRQKPGPGEMRAVALYGLSLGAMNLFFYLSLRTLPFGVAVAIELTGPLGVALLTSRRPLDFLWAGLAAAGIGPLLPLGEGIGSLDPAGTAWALGAAGFWAAYILFGKRLSHLPAGRSVSLGLATATLVAVPAGALHAGTALLAPGTLLAGLVVAVVSSAVPISLEMVALKRVPPRTFGVLLSMEPAVSALLALALLGERLESLQWLAVGLVMAASAGSSFAGTPDRAA